MRSLRLGLLVACAAAAACSLAVSLDGLQGGTAAPTDAGPADGPGPSPADAGSDRGPTDGGGTTNDGGADAGKSYCATLSPAPKLCVDFGKNRLHSGDSHVADEMDGVQAVSSPTPTLDATLFATSPPAASFDLSGKFSVLYRSYDSSPPQVRFGASMRFESATLPSAADLLELRLGGETSFMYLRTFSDGRMYLVHVYPASDGGRGQDTTILEKVTIAPKTWFRVEVVVRGTGSPSYDVLFNGAPVVTKVAMANDYPKSAPMRLLVGYTELSAAPSGALLVDDVVLDY